VAEDWRLGAAVSRAFRAPSADELFSHGPHLAAYTWEVGNPDLEPETGLGIDLFVRVEADRISAEGGVFWNEIADYSYPVNTGDRRGSLYVYRFVNTDARFLGAELSGRWLVSGPLVVDGDVSWVRATNLAFDEPLPLIPPLHGSATVRWDRERWYVEAGWEGAARQDRVPDRPDLPEGLTYCDEPGAGTDCRPVPGDVLPTDGYGIVNAGAGYRWFPGHQTHAITLSVRNLTDELYRNHLSRIKELSPEPGLGVTLTYRASF
ncbi:MAG: TonB-dependent receptor, partial [Gemmatimonadota bacterium]